MTWFLTKDTVDYCLRILAAGKTTDGTALNATFVDVCQQVILNQMAQQGAIAMVASITTAGGTFAQDECSEAIRSFWKPGGVVDPENLTRIKNEMAQQGLAGGSISFMLNTTERTLERHRVGAALGLPKCN